MTRWRSPRSLGLSGDPRDDEYIPEDDEEVADEGWAFDALYHGSIQRDHGGRAPDPSSPPPAKKYVAWAARGGDCERVLLRLGVQPVRYEIRTSLYAACALLMRDSRCDARMRDLVRAYLLGTE